MRSILLKYPPPKGTIMQSLSDRLNASDPDIFRRLLCQGHGLIKVKRIATKKQEHVEYKK
jgi:hypothetical protein